MDPKNVEIILKNDHKWSFFQYNLYIFVWIQHGCLTNRVFAVDPNNSVIKRLWCMSIVPDKRGIQINIFLFLHKMPFIAQGKLLQHN